MSAEDERRIAELERGFRRRGLPLFVAGFTASTAVFNRAAGLLGLIFLAELLGALNLDWSAALNIAALVGAAGSILAVGAALNMARSRPPFAPPSEVGALELAAFVLIPALLPLVFGGQWLSALLTALGNLVVLGLIFAVLGLGLFSIVGWAARRLLGQLAASFLLLARAVPLLLIFAVVLFLTAEVWQAFGDVQIGSLLALFVLLAALGSSFLIGRLPSEVRRLEEQADTGSEGPALERRQRINVGLVLFVSQALQVLFVCALMGAFFVVLGLLIVDQNLMEAWIGSGGDVLIRLGLIDHEALLTTELLRVSGAISAFTGLYFAIAMLTDDVYRREFLEEHVAEMRSTFDERDEYVRLMSRRSA